MSNIFKTKRLLMRQLCLLQSQALQYSSVKNIPELTLFSKAEGCSLCEDAKEELMKHSEKFEFTEVDITESGNEHWFEMYKYDIPVVHINSKEIMRHRVFEKVLLDALEIASDHK